ncbi:MAG: GIY-YIG nuclease family protein [Crocinitomicaceae bacterium]|nr:GIY-YIG nuclease family protein [Crocinitomicaceae bacterium]
MKGWMYILKCSDGTFYTGSTKYLVKRIEQHQNGEGSNYTSLRLPVELIYCEEFERIDHAFYREKQVQKWSHGKKVALIKRQYELLHKLADCKNETHFKLQPVRKNLKK